MYKLKSILLLGKAVVAHAAVLLYYIETKQQQVGGRLSPQ